MQDKPDYLRGASDVEILTPRAVRAGAKSSGEDRSGLKGFFSGLLGGEGKNNLLGNLLGNFQTDDLILLILIFLLLREDDHMDMVFILGYVLIAGF